MNDIKKPKKTAAVVAPQQLVVARRPIIGHDSKKTVQIRDANEDVHNPTAQPEPPQPLSPARRMAIAPIESSASATKTISDPEEPEVSAGDPMMESVSEEASEEVIDESIKEAPSPSVQPPKEPLAPPTPASQPPAARPTAPAGTPAPPDGVTDSSPESPDDGEETKESAETRKAVEEAAKVAKREKELEELIDARKFYVPIKTGEHKRSIKVSFGLTFLILLLAVLLIDLMLDSDTILLLQKIPHTHFFSASN